MRRPRASDLKRRAGASRSRPTPLRTPSCENGDIRPANSPLTFPHGKLVSRSMNCAGATGTVVAEAVTADKLERRMGLQLSWLGIILAFAVTLTSATAAVAEFQADVTVIVVAGGPADSGPQPSPAESQHTEAQCQAHLGCSALLYMSLANSAPAARRSQRPPSGRIPPASRASKPPHRPPNAADNN